MGWCLTWVWWIKIWEGYLESKESQLHNRSSSPGFHCQEGKSPQLLATKTRGDWVGGRNCWSPNQFLLKNLNRLNCSDSLPLSSSTRVAAWKAPVVYREKLKCLTSRRAEAIVPLLSPPHTEPISWCHIWDSINLANSIWPTLEIPRISAPPYLPAHSSCFSIWMDGLGSGFTIS